MNRKRQFVSSVSSAIAGSLAISGAFSVQPVSAKNQVQQIGNIFVIAM